MQHPVDMVCKLCA